MTFFITALLGAFGLVHGFKGHPFIDSFAKKVIIFSLVTQVVMIAFYTYIFMNEHPQTIPLGYMVVGGCVVLAISVIAYIGCYLLAFYLLGGSKREEQRMVAELKKEFRI